MLLIVGKRLSSCLRIKRSKVAMPQTEDKRIAHDDIIFKFSRESKSQSDDILGYIMKKGGLKMDISKPLTWDDLANFYDESHSGRPARTLPMEKIFDWAKRQEGRFWVSPNEGTVHVIHKKVVKKVLFKLDSRCNMAFMKAMTMAETELDKFIAMVLGGLK